MICYFTSALVALLVTVGLIAAIGWSLRTGQAWGFNVGFGFIDRAGNRIGFWSAIVLYVLFYFMALSFVWLAAAKECVAAG